MYVVGFNGATSDIKYGSIHSPESEPKVSFYMRVYPCGSK